jgi:hypothetical protein
VYVANLTNEERIIASPVLFCSRRRDHQFVILIDLRSSIVRSSRSSAICSSLRRLVVSWMTWFLVAVARSRTEQQTVRISKFDVISTS